MPYLPIVALALCAVLVPVHDASAQFSRRMGGSRADSEGRNRDRPEKAAQAVAADPFSALERELISLKVDIHLRADQVQAWAAFERDVRAAAEVDRAQRRRLLALRDPANAAPTAPSLIAGIADDARQKADSATGLQRDLQALYDRLDPDQRAMLDRRVAQSQAEPLGR